MRSTYLSQPFQYQGSKRLIAPAILQKLRLAPDSVLVEPFAGSAAVSIRAAIEKRGRSFWINDTNEPLIDLWQAIIEDPDRLMNHYSELWHAQTNDPKRFYIEVRERFNDTHKPADFLYLLARAVKGAVRYNSAGQFNQSPDNRRLGTHPQTLAKRVRLISYVLKERTRLTSIDYREMPAFFEPGQVWYMDPPYEGVSSTRNSRYSRVVNRSKFENFLREIIDLRVPFVLSYDGQTGMKTYGSPLPTELGLERIEVDAGRSTSATLLGRMDRTTEVIYVSPELQGSVGYSESKLEQLAMSLS